MADMEVKHKSVGAVYTQAEFEDTDTHDVSGLANDKLLRGDTTGNGIQDSGVGLDDSDDMTGLNSLTMNAGTNVNEFSVDGTLAGDSDDAVPTEKAVVEYVNAEKMSPWRALIITTHFDDQPASTSTITMNADLTAIIKKGMGIKFKLSGTDYYAQITTMAAGLMTIRGAPLTTGDGHLTELSVCDASRVIKMSLFVPSTYGDGSESDLLKNDSNSPEQWDHAAACLVGFSCVQSIVDSGTEPKINIELGGGAVSTNDSNNGVQLGAADTWVDNPAVEINTNNYDLPLGEEVEVSCTVAGGTGDAENLTVRAIFVLKF